jgi:hypothetical protein
MKEAKKKRGLEERPVGTSLGIIIITLTTAAPVGGVVVVITRIRSFTHYALEATLCENVWRK